MARTGNVWYALWVRVSGGSGFTLIEVMISVAIIGILAALAIPNFIHYTYRARSAEVRLMFGSIRASQQTFWGAKDNYADINVPHPVGVVTATRLRWPPAVPCPATCETTPADCTSFECIHLEFDSDTYYQYVSPAFLVPGSPTNSAEFSIGAIGDLDANGVQAGFSMQTDNIGLGGGQVPDGITACPIGLPTGTLHECMPGQW